MEKVPKIVTERLQAAMVTAAHPDADVLAAFSEQALAERERSVVLEHLARCSECREVIALALPAEETTVTAEARPAQNRWLTWPRMRWALVAAGVVTVGSVFLLQYQKKSQPQSISLFDVAPAAKQETEATNQSVPPPPAEKTLVEAKKSASPAPIPAPDTRTRNESKEFDRLDQFNKPGTTVKDSSIVAGNIGGPVRKDMFHGQQLAHGPKVLNQFQQNMNWSANTNNSSAFQVQLQTNPVAPPPAFDDQKGSNQLVVLPPGVAVPASSPAPQPARVTNQKQDLDSLAIAGRSVAPLQSVGSSGAEIARAKPATSTNAPQSADAESYALTAEGSNFSPSGSLAPESTRWSINSTGGLQRSMDQGQTWQDVDVKAGYGRGAGLGLERAMKSRDKTLAKVAAEAKEKPIVFRAVAANGPDVWAGGSEGNLYHSTDSGAHWLRIVPSWRGIDLMGDIINLQFADPQHGRIVTSAAEIWITVDAGQTWEKH